MENTALKPQQISKISPRGSLEAFGLEVGYDRVPVIKDLSFVAEPGLFHTILGPNGSGKSTLLKALTGELPYSGRVALNGESLSTIRAETLALRRGVLPQHTVLAFPLTVSEVVSLGVLRNDTVGTAKQRRNRIFEALGMVDLEGFEGRQYQSLSGGEQQRVQLARVLCQVWSPMAEDGSRRWLFLDEPVSSLDIKHQIQIMNIAADYARRGGGVLAVMHDLNLTASFADTVMVIRNGELKIMGSVAAVYKDEILSDAYDYDVQVSHVDGRSAPIVLARHG
ncbi:heme ABC transporter ATP-binding protein [Roseibium polysiphoniae]|uniref:Heme ABC transporter ATP-binding protein n=1 Tax=Roseibium polysiphoniae TaxID=2571221 RepID=A0A944CCD5_9HYPH|nr:heme ABC transporter ATP-binding protein [Roseibium polysiphoniae]